MQGAQIWIFLPQGLNSLFPIMLQVMDRHHLHPDWLWIGGMDEAFPDHKQPLSQLLLQHHDSCSSTFVGRDTIWDLMERGLSLGGAINRMLPSRIHFLNVLLRDSLALATSTIVHLAPLTSPANLAVLASHVFPQDWNVFLQYLSPAAVLLSGVRHEPFCRMLHHGYRPSAQGAEGAQSEEEKDAWAMIIALCELEQVLARPVAALIFQYMYEDPRQSKAARLLMDQLASPIRIFDKTDLRHFHDPPVFFRMRVHF